MIQKDIDNTKDKISFDDKSSKKLPSVHECTSPTSKFEEEI